MKKYILSLVLILCGCVNMSDADYAAFNQMNEDYRVYQQKEQKRTERYEERNFERLNNTSQAMCKNVRINGEIYRRCTYAKGSPVICYTTEYGRSTCKKEAEFFAEKPKTKKACTRTYMGGRNVERCVFDSTVSICSTGRRGSLDCMDEKDYIKHYGR